MDEILNSVISKIEDQQKQCENQPAWFVGEQLKSMCKESREIAEIIVKDLDAEGMSIIGAEKKIKEYADSHRKGKCGFVPPDAADEILRKFYGLPGKGEEASEPEQAGSKVIDLTAFL